MRFEDEISVKNVPEKLRDHYLILIVAENLKGDYQMIMRWTTSHTMYWIINCNSNVKKIITPRDFPPFSTALLAIYSNEARSREMHLVVQDKFIS